MGEEHALKADLFFSQYDSFLAKKKLNLDFGIDCYLQMLDDIALERNSFIRNGQYSSCSFDEVEKRVYGNPEVMNYHMHGLVLAQFLWFEQFERFSFFSANLKKYATKTKNYLEIGGGHGLYIFEALKLLPEAGKFDLVDVSRSSIDLASGIIDNDKVNYHLKNIFDFSTDGSYDFVTMGEVLEHVEDPLVLLRKIGELIGNTGVSFISTPINSPMIDHIYLFNDEQEIRELLNTAGLEVVDEMKVISEHVSENYARKFKVPIMFAAIVKLKNDKNGQN
ncbi:MAG: class I SAM-dependent methyltransferase [Lentimicrobium sp.]